MMRSRACVAEIERIVTRDEGGRNIKRIVEASRGSLQKAAEIICSRDGRTLILTGFPCMVKQKVPQESDGPSGSLCLARALSFMGRRVTLLTDTCNVNVLRACYESAATFAGDEFRENVEILSFPPTSTKSETEWTRTFLTDVIRNDVVSSAIAIERSGPTATGDYLTMRGTSMTHMMAPLDRLFPMCAKMDIPTIAIGDGGNELGMGNVREIVEADVANGSKVSCAVSSDVLIPCSVSNWGGYALAGSIGVVLGTRSTDVRDRLKILPTPDEEAKIVDAGVAVGMCDGVSGRRERTVDGLPWSESERVLSAIRSQIKLARQKN